jgi:glycosyltransferase involved in cell wall biosynthesis
MAPTSLPEVALFLVDAGGGHRATANALVAAAEARGCPWRFRVTSIQAVLNRLDVVRRATGLPIEEVYNLLLRRQWTAHLVPLLRLLQLSIRALRVPLRKRIARELRSIAPAAVVSVAPNFNAILRDAVREACPGRPFAVLLSDLADFPPHFWIEPGVDLVIVGTDRGAAQAREAGLAPERIGRTSGMVLHPRFYPRPGPEVRASVRRELGLSEEDPAAALLFGGKGCREMLGLAAALLRENDRFRVVALCGDNPPLLGQMGSLAARSNGRLHPLGFTDRVRDYLAACDVVAMKPGPGSLAEALHVGTPVVVIRNRRTIPQERFNADLVTERGLGLVVGDWDELPHAIGSVLTDPDLRERLRAGIAALPENRAVWEALDLVGAFVDARDHARENVPRSGTMSSSPENRARKA